jgi:hypothetical protein
VVSFFPSVEQFKKGDEEIRKSTNSLNDLKADLEIGDSPAFDDTLIIGFEDKLLIATPIMRGGKKIYSVNVSILDANSFQEIDSIGLAMRPQGKSYRVLGRRSKKRVLDIVIDENGIITKGFVDDGTQKKDLAGQNFVSQGNDAIRTTRQELSDSASNLQAGLVAASDPLKCLNDCLASRGIPSWVIGVIGTVCAAVCITRAIKPCAICLGTVLGLQLNVGVLCLKQCSFR